MEDEPAKQVFRGIFLLASVQAIQAMTVRVVVLGPDRGKGREEPGTGPGGDQSLHRIMPTRPVGVLNDTLHCVTAVWSVSCKGGG
jgi:hypothetical protein